MTDTEKAALEKRIDELCAEVESWRMVATSRTKQCAEVNEANDALQAENAKLCAEVEALKRDEWSAGFNAGCDAVNAAIEDGKSHYEAENVELRVLVADAHGCKVNEGCCEDCYADQGSCPIEVRMEQLGIEVN